MPRTQGAAEETSSIHADTSLLSHAARLWFPARKVRPIWARQLDQPERISTLEGDENVPAGMFVCRGEAGDVWAQPPERLNTRYVATDEIVEGWQKHVPHPHSRVLAARIAEAFHVTTRWGVLRGKPGDYLLKDDVDRDASVPADLWIVDAALFHATYERVTEDIP